MAVALEEEGFEIRDMIAWHYKHRSLFKAFSQDHFVRRMNISEAEKDALISSLAGRKTPQLRPQYEYIYDVLGKETLVKWYIEYPKDFSHQQLVERQALAVTQMLSEIRQLAIAA